MPKVGLLRDTRDHIAAIIQIPNISSQPYWNYYSRPVPRADIDRLHVAVSTVAEAYELREVTEPVHEQRYGIGTYGFAIADHDGNWWRIEDRDGPFGLAELPAVEGTSIIPPGPVAYVTLESADLDKTSQFYRENLCRFDTNRFGLIKDGRLYDLTPVLDMLPPRAWPFPQHDVVIEHLVHVVRSEADAPANFARETRSEALMSRAIRC